MAKWKYHNQVEFISNGEWNDPQLEFNGQVVNYYSVFDALYSFFTEDCNEFGIEDTEENFVIFCQNNTDLIEELFENLK